jgi:hypothetical protein
LDAVKQEARTHRIGGFLAKEGRPMRASLYARDSAHSQLTLALQVEAMTAYINDHGWDVLELVKDVGSGEKQRPGRLGRPGMGWPAWKWPAEPARTEALGTADSAPWPDDRFDPLGP